MIHPTDQVQQTPRGKQPPPPASSPTPRGPTATKRDYSSSDSDSTSDHHMSKVLRRSVSQISATSRSTSPFASSENSQSQPISNSPSSKSHSLSSDRSVSPIDAQGSSQATGGFARGHAAGNVINAADIGEPF